VQHGVPLGGAAGWVDVALILLLGAFAVGSHELTLGGLVAFIALALQLVWPIEAMGYILATAQEAATAAQRVFELFDTAPAITGRRSAGGARPAKAPAGGARLAFDGVAFGYPGAGRRVLRDITLDLEPGTTLALAGATTYTGVRARKIESANGRATAVEATTRGGGRLDEQVTAAPSAEADVVHGPAEPGGRT